ncbi:hypothetical protein KM914_16245 [Virgibacillus pantothenticus]|nr:hypothetical protein [Virgibacillus pantothenticus]MBU8665464.1 hypothetical protein [Virgibacillus pantothenticus]MBU8669880.1 hypothetical protein [Virgibacillus pantothenticus]MBU8705670.1 hypothetical protein [Virgibacillus pantothenticus]
MSSPDDERLEDNFNVDYYIVPLGKQKEALLIANDLRKEGYKVEYEMSGKKLRKSLEKANRERIHYVIIVGEEEVKNNQFKIKDMFSGDERVESYQFR